VKSFLLVVEHFRVGAVGCEAFVRLCQCVRDSVKGYVNSCPWMVAGARLIERVLQRREVVDGLLNPGFHARVFRGGYQFMPQRLQALKPHELLLSLSGIGHDGILDRSTVKPILVVVDRGEMSRRVSPGVPGTWNDHQAMPQVLRRLRPR